MLVNTGSRITLVREDALGTLQPVLQSGVTASGEKLKLLVETNVMVTMRGKCLNII